MELLPLQLHEGTESQAALTGFTAVDVPQLLQPLSLSIQSLQRVLIHAPMPSPWTGGWDHEQYAKGDYPHDANVFISSGDNRNEHWERRSWGFSLMRLMELYGNDFSAEVIYEYYAGLKVTVKKRSRP